MRRIVIITAAIMLTLVLSSESLVAYTPTPDQSPLGAWTPFLVVDARPLDAQVFLDGKPLGTARELIALALPVQPGRHVIQIVHPGFKPFWAQFSADPRKFPAIIRATLVPA